MGYQERVLFSNDIDKLFELIEVHKGYWSELGLEPYSILTSKKDFVFNDNFVLEGYHGVIVVGDWGNYTGVDSIFPNRHMDNKLKLNIFTLDSFPIDMFMPDNELAIETPYKDKDSLLKRIRDRRRGVI